MFWLQFQVTEKAQDYIKICRGHGGAGVDKVVAQVPTKSGIHLICHPFDVGQLEGYFNLKNIPIPDIHKNNPTLLFYCEP